MAIYKTYIQQISFDGQSYVKGTVIDILEKFNMVCQEFPFKKNPKPKDLPTRDWAGSDGLDVYVPATLPMKEYDIDVDFLYVGEEAGIRQDLTNFLDFICGRIKGNEQDTVESGRLAIYNEHVGFGRKDVVVSEIDDELYYLSDFDPDAVAKFKVKFKIYDPTTDVTPSYTGAGVERTATQLNF